MLVLGFSNILYPHFAGTLKCDLKAGRLLDLNVSITALKLPKGL